MKKLFITAALLLGLVYGGFAQNRSITFEKTKKWKQIVEKAATEKKLIFVDCYTDWCVPCKMLAANVFTQDAVADFFNENFVNAKFEMEKDYDGTKLKNKYEIEAYPTLLFVDPATGDVVHKVVGAGSAEYLIKGAREALNSESNLRLMTARYESGDRDSEFILKYIEILKAANMKEEATKVHAEYLRMEREKLAD